MFKNKYYIFFTFLLIGLNFVFAQDLSNDFSFVSIKKGISERAVHNIIEDQDGYKWIGTNGVGIIRFDGINYKAYTYDWNNDSSINSDVIYATFIDNNNRLWVGTNSGLNLYNRDLDKFERIDLSSISGIDTNENVSVQSIIQDEHNNLILGILNIGALKLHKNTFKLSKIESITVSITSDLSINDFAKNSNGQIYAATNYGLKVIDSNTNTLEDFIEVIENDTIRINEPLESLIIDNTNNLWLGTNNKGVIKISEKKHQVDSFYVSDKRIMSLMNTEDDKILCGTENDGLILLDKDGNIIKHYTYDKFDKNSLRSNSVWSLYLDSNKRIWLGYYNKGIGVYDKLYNKFHSIESLTSNSNSLQAGSVTGIAKDKLGKLWISMEGGGLDVYNPLTKKFRHVNKNNQTYYKGLKSDDLQTVFIDSKENIWLGSWSGGIYFLEKGTNTFINYNKQNTKGGIQSNKIMNFCEDSNGLIWFATFSKGVHFYNPKSKDFTHCSSESFKKHDIDNLDARVVFNDSKDNIWLGTTTGLFKLNFKKSGSFSITSMKDSMSALLKDHPSTHQILSIYETKDKRILIGTDGGGIFIFNPETKDFHPLNNIKNLKENSISSIIESNDGRIWVGGQSGIMSLNLKKKEVRHFTTDDGLLSNDFNNNAVLKDEKGILYFGSYLGVNYISPRNIPINNSEPYLHFTNFKLFNKEVLPDDKKSPLDKVISETENITLTHDQSVFTIEYVGINYTHPEKNQYAYYLEGFDTNWNYVGNTRSVTYTNLEHGDYIFKVKSANNDGIWNKTPLEIKIKVLPPWWLTNLAYLLYIIFVIIGILLLDFFMRNRIKQKQAVQFEIDKRLQEEKLNQKKLQFFTNISHEFRTPLTLIMNPMADIMKNDKLDLPFEVRKKHQIIYKNSDRLSRLINELMDFRKLQSNKIDIQVQEISVSEQIENSISYFKMEALQRNILLTTNNNVGSLSAWLDINMLEKIMFNLISNAFKVTPDYGKITIDINKTSQTVNLPLLNTNNSVEALQISVSDTGPGLDQKEYKKIFNRFYQVGQLNKSYYGSTGIGLELVKNFIELHKGKIEVESTLGQGTKFIIIFPLGKDHFSKNEIFNNENRTKYLEEQKHISPPVIESLYSDEEISNQEKKHTLLIVEDNSELKKYLKNELKNKYKILTAVNGRKGLEIAKEKSPDIIITDVVMPLMDGIAMCEMIKKDLKTSHIPLLMLTSKAMIEDKLKGIDSGADAYLSKPFNMSILKSTLNQLLKSRQILFNKHYQSISKISKDKTTTLDNVFIQKVLDYIHNNISETDLSVELLASKLFLSRSQLYRKIKALTGLSVNEFIRKIRLEKAKQLLESGNHNISEITYKVGFSSPSYFTKCFKAQFNILPTEIKKNNT